MIQNLRKLRKEKGVSQQKLADDLGTSQQSIHQYENSAVEPDIDTLKKFARYFDTSVDYLIGKTHIRCKPEATKDFRLTDQEALLLDRFRYLDEEQRESLLGFLAAMARE